jgi:dTDP-4-amino-4,6-dideoxygalactose transaminase
MIPFNRPTIIGGELAALDAVLHRSKISGDGPDGRACEAMLEKALSVPRVLLTTSCTHALEMSAMLLDIGPEDEVIVPSFTFVSTANAFVLRGARPVFADIRPDTMNLDERKLEALITKRTKAIVPVHYAGVGCAMDVILDIARKHHISVIEDNAHGLFGEYRGRMLGSFGATATQSFHETKNFSCGEGGALVISDESLVERAEILREKGTNRSRFFRGQVDKYTWVDVGSSYVISDVLASLLRVQLEAREQIQARRKHVWTRYASELADWAAARGVQVPTVPSECTQTFHMFYLVFDAIGRRTAFIEHMKERGVHATFHYVPLHLSPMGQRFGGRVGTCPVSERISDGLVRLPFFTNLADAEIDHVVAAVRSFE